MGKRMTDYSKDCKNQQEAKILYRRLAMKFHPDKGGNNDLMNDLKEQYERFKPQFYKNTEERQQNMQQQSFNPFFQQTKQYQTIRFDHPIHEFVRNLQKKIEELSNTLSTLNNEKAWLNTNIKRLEEELETRDEYAEAYEKFMSWSLFKQIKFLVKLRLWGVDGKDS
jgi:curved DNA-binding protein CbpA